MLVGEQSKSPLTENQYPGQREKEMGNAGGGAASYRPSPVLQKIAPGEKLR